MADALPSELIALIASHIDEARVLCVLARMSTTLKRATYQEWERLALLNFPHLRHITAGLAAPAELLDWRALYREQHYLSLPPAPAPPVAAKPRLKDFLFTIEILENGQHVMEPWVGTLEASNGPGGPWTRMWSRESQPALTSRLRRLVDVGHDDGELLAEQISTAEALSNSLRCRIWVSRATPRGPRTIKLYDGYLSNFPALRNEDWIAFEGLPAPLAPEKVAAMDACRTNLDGLPPAFYSGLSFTVHPWIKLEDGFVDELVHPTAGGASACSSVQLLTYLEHLAPW